MAVISNDIKTGEFAKIYLLYGDERYLVNTYRDRLISALIDSEDNLNFMKFSGSGVDTSEIISFCSELPFFSDRRVALIENSGLFKKSNEEFANSLSRLEDTSVAVFVEMEVDSRYKLFKTVDKCGRALEFVTPDEAMLVRWVRQLFRRENIEAEDSAVYSVIEAASMDMNCIKNEVDKLVSYAADKGVVSGDDVRLLCGRTMETRVYQMVDSIVAGQTEKACAIYHDLLANKESVIMINAAIMGQFNRILLAKLAAGAPDAEVAKTVGCPVWAVKNYRAQGKNFSENGLRKVVDACQQLDYRMKTCASVDAVDMETMIVSLCGRTV